MLALALLGQGVAPVLLPMMCLMVHLSAKLVRAHRQRSFVITFFCCRRYFLTTCCGKFFVGSHLSCSSI